MRIRGSKLKIQLSPATIAIFSWNNMKGPLSVTFASLMAMLITQILGYYNVPKDYQLDTPGAMIGILAIMEMGTSERFYMKTTYRVIGAVTGVGVGMLYAYIERVVKDHSSLLPKSDLTGALIGLRVGLLTPTIFVATVCMKKFPMYSQGISVLMIHVPPAMIAKDYQKALAVTVSLGVAVFVSVISLVSFERVTSESTLLETNKKCVHGVLSVVQLAITADPVNTAKFTKHTNEIHKAISSAETAIRTYGDWRSMTCRNPVHDFKALMKPIRPLFYQGYALYWTNVSAFHANEYKANILFCDNQLLYDKHFRDQVEEMVHIIEGIKDTLGNIFSHSSHKNQVPITELVDIVIVNGLWNGICRLQESLKKTYLLHRKDCFSTIRQRWNVLDYLRQLAMITLAFVEFCKTLVKVFETPDRQERVLNLLNEIAEGLDRLRKEEDKKNGITGAIFGTYSTLKPTYSGLSLVSLGITTNTKADSPTSLMSNETSQQSLIAPIPEEESGGIPNSPERRPLLKREDSLGGI